MLIAFVRTTIVAFVGDLYGSWPKLGTMAAFGIATGAFWVCTTKKYLTVFDSTLYKLDFTISFSKSKPGQPRFK